MKQKAIFYHAGCSVCVDAEQRIASALDPTAYDVEIVHLGNEKGRLNEAEAAGVKCPCQRWSSKATRITSTSAPTSRHSNRTSRERWARPTCGLATAFKERKRMAEVSETWLPSLAAPTPKAGFALAAKLARMGVKFTQPSDAIRQELRPAYKKDAIALIAASHVIAIHFQTTATANNWWKS